MTLAAGTRLGPYEVLGPLGAGGMGEVYRARDTRLGRDVAIKVLHDDVAADAERLRRFEREALAVAALSHPNILAIHDFGTEEGTAYAVMELLEGETLREKLQAPIPQKQAVDYALQIAKGLAAAHERGIVHRDLKPENLFVTKDGHLKILDFGLAKKVVTGAPGAQIEGSTVSDLTEPGIVVGTVSYMSPEQVRGFALDQRSDIFSFGAILYELLSGERAFSRPTASDTIAAIMRDEPLDLSESGRGIPPALDHIVRHCLEKNRENRFQSAKDIAFNLSEVSGSMVVGGVRAAAVPNATSRVLIAAAVIAVLAAASVVFFRVSDKGPSGGSNVIRRVAVLPFENLGAAEDDYFADGMADEVRGKLTTLRGVQVIARASSTPYKKSTKTPREIAKELDVAYLLTATVRWQKGGASVSRVVVRPELVEISGSGAPASKWQQRFDASLTDVFQVQSDIATRVAQSLGVALGARDEKRLLTKPTQSLAAYDAFLKGEEVSNNMAVQDAPTLRNALGFYDQAVALDPHFAQAWVRVSLANSLLYANSTPTPELAERARQTAEKAAALAPDLPDVYLALGNYERLVLRDYGQALEQYAKGNRVGPGSAGTLGAAGVTEQYLGHWDSALEYFKRAERLDPGSVLSKLRLGGALLWLRRYAEAREAFDRGLALAPLSLDLIEDKAVTFLGEGDLAGARAVLKAAPKEVETTALVAYLATYWDLVWVLDEEQRELLLRLTPSAFDNDTGVWSICLVQAYALKGDATKVRTYAERARKAFEQQLRVTPGDAQRHFDLGLALAYLGRKHGAIMEGERAVALSPVSKDAYNGPYYQHQLARIYMLVGEPEKALDRLEPLLKMPYLLSSGWLKIDPNFDPLRREPRFQKLVDGK